MDGRSQRRIAFSGPDSPGPIAGQGDCCAGETSGHRRNATNRKPNGFVGAFSEMVHNGEDLGPFAPPELRGAGEGQSTDTRRLLCQPDLLRVFLSEFNVTCQ
jgi:hypothetical protein